MGKVNLGASSTQCPVPPMLEIFKPLIDAATGVSLSDPEAARLELTSRLDPDSPEGQRLSQALIELLEAGKVAAYALMGRSGYEERRAEIEKSLSGPRRTV